MNDENKVEKLRKELYAQAAVMEDINYSRDFQINFFKLVEMCIFALMESDDNFFGAILINMKRVIRFDINYPLTSVPFGQYFILYINPVTFLECSFKQMQALIKHEVYHIISGHHYRARELKSKYSQLAISLAMDISINQYIINLPPWSETIERVRLSYNVDLKEEGTLEQYAEDIQKALNKLVKNRSDKKENIDPKDFTGTEPDIGSAHAMWENTMDLVDQHQLEEIVKKMVAKAYHGKAPKSIEDIIAKLNLQPEIKWPEYLRRMVGTVPYGHKRTVTRKDRRQPERLDLRGRMASHTARLLVAIDISGSVTDKEIESIMAEIFSIVKNYNTEITIIECDDEIRRLYPVNNIRQVKKKLNLKGATKFSPVFQFMREKNLRDCVLIYFTDGLGEEELTCHPQNRRVLWVLTGKNCRLSLANPPGKVITLTKSSPVEKVNMYEFIRNEMRDNISEWAK